MHSQVRIAAVLLAMLPVVFAGTARCGDADGDWMASLFDSAWIRDALHALQEPKIGRLPDDVPSYRFLWFRAHNRAVAITIERTSRGAVLTLKALDKPYTIAPHGIARGSLTIDRRVDLTSDQWYELNALALKGFWQSSSRDSSGIDGAYWMVEGTNGEDDHRVVVQWSPDDSPFRQFCMRMLEISTLDLRHHEQQGAVRETTCRITLDCGSSLHRDPLVRARG